MKTSVGYTNIGGQVCISINDLLRMIYENKLKGASDTVILNGLMDSLKKFEEEHR